MPITVRDILESYLLLKNRKADLAARGSECRKGLLPPSFL